MKKIKKLPVWDLTDFYEFPESESLKRDIDKIEIRTKRFYKNFKGKLRKLSNTELLNSLKEFESIEELINSIRSYIYFGNILNLVTKYSPPLQIDPGSTTLPFEFLTSKFKLVSTINPV